MYDKVSTNLNFVEREKKVKEFWDNNHIFEKSMEIRKAAYSQWQAPYWPRFDQGHQGYDSQIQNYERL